MDNPAARPPHFLVVFSLDDQKYALPLSRVERIFRAAQPSPLPKAPEIVIGLLNIRGRIIPVVDPRIRLRLPKREIGPSDHFIIAHTSKRTIVITADAVLGVTERFPQELIPTKDILEGLDYVEGVIKLKDGLILINDIDRFLSLNEEKSLEMALDGA
ncbi:MAG: chemotaxis protein CheW [Elusimicrobiota bacterium]